MNQTSPADRVPAPPGAHVPAVPRPNRRRRPPDASWACIFSVDLLSRRFFADGVLPLATVLLLVAAVAGAIGLTYVAL